jgi:pyruvate dehydrogenase E2 component (dihydrolipoamide acetyltransferase)
VADAQARPQGSKGEAEVIEPTTAEAGHARRVAEAKATVPHIYLDAHLAGEPSTAQLVQASARALRDHPRLNATYRDGRFEIHSRVNIGVAVEAGGALVYPVIADADGAEVEAIEGALGRLVAQAREGTITQPDLSGATFSLADLAGRGADRIAMTINRGQSAMLGVAGGPGSGRTLTLACDNRIVQAAEGAAYLGTLRRLLA